MKDKLLVNQIIPFSNVDGDGNRLSIFVQGCNINCIYCHNSETISHCNHCGLCVAPCPSGALSLENGFVKYEKRRCTGCDTCINICPSQSTPKAEYYNKDELMNIIVEYGAYIRGITVSGGEPTLNYKFLRELFIDVKKLGLTCYIDTNGYFDFEEIYSLIEETDGFLFDVKAVENQFTLCGTTSEAPLKNLISLLEMEKIAEVRTVVLSDFMDSENTVKVVAGLLSGFNGITYKLMKVHLTGLKRKQKENIRKAVPTDIFMTHLKSLAYNKGADIIKIIG
ncbi:MAG: YjjW family glycine radical enzyme activase [Spirochaetaceae bacterium]|nr:YjjW family glycine radical enzyme activase [Spirochaetaceae bacterium]